MKTSILVATVFILVTASLAYAVSDARCLACGAIWDTQKSYHPDCQRNVKNRGVILPLTPAMAAAVAATRSASTVKQVETVKVSYSS